MLFSLSTGKSRSSWLDRLRTAKGFPDSGVTDLDNFLKNPNSPDPQSLGPRLTDPHLPISDSIPNEGKQFFNIFSDVLHELFNFGDKCTSNSTRFKKSARKQANPRICAFPNNWDHENNNAASEKVTLLRSGDSNSGVEGVTVLDKLENEGEGEGLERDVNLAGFSRTEVTVIDTSYELWKFEKLLYRKNNVWKVRDKKGKSEVMRSKKNRKVGGGVVEDRQGGKKWKNDKKKGNAGECQLPMNEKNRSEVDQVGRRTVEKNQTDLKLEDGTSSVILIRSIGNGKKRGTSSSNLPIKGSVNVKSKQKES